MQIFTQIIENECVSEIHPFVKGDNFDKYWAITGKQYETVCTLPLGLFTLKLLTGFRFVSKLVTLNDLE